MILGASPLGSKDAQLGAVSSSITELVGRIIRLVGSYIATIPMIGGYVTSITVTGSVGEDGN